MKTTTNSTTTNNQPKWVTQPITKADLAAINQGGCASGAYMPAVTYRDANQTMADHGEAVIDYICEQTGDFPCSPREAQTWGQVCSYYLTYAVEIWCHLREDQADWDDDDTLAI